MQEKLARLHFGLDVCVEELPEEQKKVAADRNLDQLLAHVSATPGTPGTPPAPAAAGTCTGLRLPAAASASAFASRSWRSSAAPCILRRALAVAVAAMEVAAVEMAVAVGDSVVVAAVEMAVRWQ